ncbi:MAG: PKD domain-containing protein [Sphingobacteriales bacterium]|nr:PKD domain-containing protein [Sphingobacteriales bacterium]
MNKFLLILLVSVLISSFAFSQTAGGPDTYGYTWKNSNHNSSPPPFSWVDITTRGTQVIGLGDDNYIGPIYLSSPFHYYWYDINKFYIGSNGYVSFDGNNIASPFPASIPLSSGANNWIAPLMADLNFSGTNNPGKCYYFVNSDSIVISYIDVPFWVNATTPYTGQNTFQIVLSRLDSSITFNYLITNMGTLTSIDDAVGIENSTGTIGISNYIDVLPPDTMSIKYYYPKVVTYQVTDAGIRWNDNTKNGGIFLKKDGGQYSLKSNIRNFGNQNIGNFTIYDTVLNSSSQVVSAGSKTISSLGVGIDSTITFPNTFNPSNAGTYQFITSIVGLTTDMVASNNRMIQEIIVVDTTPKTVTLDYSDGSSNGGLGWNGGGGGIAEYFEPPFYPCKIVSTRFYITANATTPVGFYAKIYDDNGPNGSHGTLLDSVYVSPSSISLNTYLTINTASSNIKITSGGVYLYWEMGGAGINLGRDNTPPISRRTYEVLAGSWADYRSIDVEDFLMSINIEHTYPYADFTADSSADPKITFSDKSSNSPTSWKWDFGDNSSYSYQQNPSHTYTANGTYKVCLTASNTDGSNTLCKYQTVRKVPPVAAFSADTLSDPKVTFTDNSTNIPTSWYWDFDDKGGFSTAKNPVYTFQVNGIHKVCLKVTNAGGSDSTCKYIKITKAAPYADFAVDTTQDPKLAFIDKSLNSPTSWKWDFGDNSASSSLQNPTHTYTRNGTFKVCLIASSSYGSDTTCKNVTVYKIPPKAYFTFDQSKDPTISFTDTSQNIPTSWLWNFDDNGATSTAQNPTYTFTVNGLHKVCLKVSNPGGSDSICKNITLLKVPPISDFEIDTTQDPKIVFTDKSKNIPTNWMWDFDDNGAKAYTQNATHTFSQNGTYNVCLQVYNAGGFHTACKSVTIRKIPPKALFTADTNADPVINFYDLSSNQPTSWKWDFGDGSGTSSIKNPSYKFQKNGVFNVCLKVTNLGGSDSICKNINVKNVPPEANFSYDKSQDPIVVFTDLSTNLPTAWLWDFDDNFTTSNLKNPVHTFSTNGNHNVCLIVSNAGGKDTLCQLITINNVPPVADFIYNNSTDPTLSFTDKSKNNPTSWLWNFDEVGGTSNQQNPVYTFKKNGTHKVCLKATNGGGSDSICKNILVRKVPPIADFVADTSLDPTISFTDKSTNDPLTWTWNFDDDGGYSNSQNPVYTFKTNGKHNVCLKVTNIGGNHETCKTITIRNIPPKADFIFDANNDPIVQFTDKSTNLPITWKWDFDDHGNTSSDQNPTYSFIENGMHLVCLKVSNNGGSDSVCKQVTVQKSLPVAGFIYDDSAMPTVSFTDQSVGSPVEWHWDFDDKGNDSSALKNPVYTFRVNGLHHVCLIVKNSAGYSQPTCKDITVTGAGLTENLKNYSLQVIPNPFSSSASIVVSSEEQIHARFFNSIGQEVYFKYQIGKDKILIYRDNLPAGMYSVEIFGMNEKIGQAKFVVQ